MPLTLPVSWCVGRLVGPPGRKRRQGEGWDGPRSRGLRGRGAPGNVRAPSGRRGEAPLGMGGGRRKVNGIPVKRGGAGETPEPQERVGLPKHAS